MNELQNRPKPKNFVEANPSKAVVRRMNPAELNTVQHSLDIAPTATSHIETRTSHVDRAKGYLIMHLPMFTAFSATVLILAVAFFSVPFLSITAIVIVFISFTVAWLGSFILTMILTPEFIALFESISKWQVVKREQKERWDYHKRQEGE